MALWCPLVDQSVHSLCFSAKKNLILLSFDGQRNSSLFSEANAKKTKSLKDQI